MQVRIILLVSLLLPLYGCQPDAPTPKADAPAAVESAAPPPQPPVVQAEAQPVAETPAAPHKAEPAPAAKIVQPAPVEKVAVAQKEQSPQPAVAEKPDQPVPVPAAEAEPTPATTASAKPEAESVAEVSEADGVQLAKKSNCLGCHAIDKKKVGPAFKDVAAKYRGDAGAEAYLVNVIGKGGKGVWGVMAMPPNPQVSEADRKILAKFVLSLK